MSKLQLLGITTLSLSVIAAMFLEATGRLFTEVSQKSTQIDAPMVSVSVNGTDLRYKAL